LKKNEARQIRASKVSGTRSIAIATAVSTTTTATAASAVLGTTGAGSALFTRAGDVHGQGAAVNGLAVQRGNGVRRFLVRAHGDESKPAGTASGTVHHQIGFDDSAMCGKGVLQVVFGGFAGKISYKQFVVITHVMFSLYRLCAIPRLSPVFGFKIITELSSPEDLPYLETDKRIEQTPPVCSLSGELQMVFCNYFRADSSHRFGFPCLLGERLRRIV
jgi:hypothetical protein